MHVQELVILIICLFTFFAFTRLTSDRMEKAFLFLVLGAAIFIWLIVWKKIRLSRVPNVSEEEFLARYRQRFQASPEAVVTERRYIARMLGIPVEKLSPEQKVEELPRYVRFFGSDSVALNNLFDEVNSLFEQVGLTKLTRPPETIGELINEILKAKQTISH